MTTLRDLLNDFANDVEEQVYRKGQKDFDLELAKEQLIDDYIYEIKERIVG